MHTRTPTAIVLVTVLGLARATPATSEPAEGNGQAAHAFAQVKSGARVRVEREGGRVLEGRYVTVTDDGDVVLAEPAARIPAASIQKVWLRGRAFTTGAIVGGIVLGAVTALGARPPAPTARAIVVTASSTNTARSASRSAQEWARSREA